MAIALFILGNAGCGKTQLAKRWVKTRVRNGEAWCMIDKDTTGHALARAYMTLLGLDPNDRDSPAYREKVRDLEYQCCLDVVCEQLKLGVNVVIPGPWNQEIASGKLFSQELLGFPKETSLKHVYLDLSEGQIKHRIVSRKNDRDQWKLDNWVEYAKRLSKPHMIHHKKVLTLTTRDSNKEQIEKLEELCNAKSCSMIK
jgi:predicted kinase